MKKMIDVGAVVGLLKISGVGVESVVNYADSTTQVTRSIAQPRNIIVSAYLHIVL